MISFEAYQSLQTSSNGRKPLLSIQQELGSSIELDGQECPRFRVPCQEGASRAPVSKQELLAGGILLAESGWQGLTLALPLRLLEGQA